MINLSAFGPLWGVPDPSPFVIKTEVQLKMAGLPYRTFRARPPEAPKGKLPFIDDDGVQVGDSTFIRDYIQWKHGLDLDAGLSPRQRALAWTVERVVEDHLYWAIVYFRWAAPENFDKGAGAAFFAGAPDEVREGGRKHMGAVLHGQGFGRHSAEEVGDLAARSVTALAEIVGDGPYLSGELICGADATLFAGLTAALSPHFDTPVRDAILGHANLVAYHDRMRARFYPAGAEAQSVAA
ncbi:glutathione S-transferase family protein [Phenylobacterium sp.]|jgi:glutathione S-transferase|uniref:glutathione S-transferase family protein n=1 Tax=Phenylobacterium sp. TaxID=1871053 RepID=UPI002E2EC501|nr:glutathione S-transferase family protein [Phenylobacterium sp.]HEX3365343.1 glutathione S-transferase family protein [Phenylobacterium sp.]